MSINGELPKSLRIHARTDLSKNFVRNEVPYGYGI